MSALNEINQLISTFSQQPKPEWLTPAVITVRLLTVFVIEYIMQMCIANMILK